MKYETALERQDLSRTYLAHHELESEFKSLLSLYELPDGLDGMFMDTCCILVYSQKSGAAIGVDNSCACMELMYYQYVFMERADKSAVPWLVGVVQHSHCRLRRGECMLRKWYMTLAGQRELASMVASCHAMHIQKLSQQSFVSSQIWNELRQTTAKSLVFLLLSDDKVWITQTRIDSVVP